MPGVVGARRAGPPGLPDALRLLARLTRQARHTPLRAELDDLEGPVRLGDPEAEPARYVGDAATLVRLYAGRRVEGRTFELAGVEPEDLDLFG